MTNRSRKSSVVKATVNAQKARRSLFTSPAQTSAYDRWSSEVQTPGGNAVTRLLVGTALGTALGVGTLVGGLVTTGPAQAACVLSGTIENCTGPLLTGIGPYTNPPVTDITVVGAKVGQNSATDGITFSAAANGKTLTVTTDAATTIGVGVPYAITRDGIHVFSSYNNTQIVITSAAAIGSATQPVGNAGIYARIDGADYVGNTSESIVITNSGAIFSNGNGIHAEIEIESDPGLISKASVNISNSGAINSKYSGIFVDTEANADAGKGKSGTATSTATIVNSGAITSTNGYGIDASAVAKAGSDDGLVVLGGTATATTTITNSGAISSSQTAINGEATANAEGVVDSVGGGSGTGGKAVATVTISNLATLTSKYGSGIYGLAASQAVGAIEYSASTNGKATGGNATSTVTIINSGAISAKNFGIYGHAEANASAENTYGGATGSAQGGTAASTVTINNSGIIQSSNDGIRGKAEASASGEANNYSKDYAKGGTASATVTISNSGAITSKGKGIKGVTESKANGAAYTAVGGAASSATNITNSAAITSTDDGIYARAQANADASGSYSALGKGTGGTATAATIVINTGAITSKDKGIYGGSSASANGSGYTGIGGSATGDARTTIVNSGAISSTNDGIDGRAFSNANGNGSFNKLGVGTGGSAISITTISNTGAITNLNGEAIEGYSSARARGYGFTATGGKAAATTTIFNTGALTSLNVGGEAAIYAGAVANTNARASQGTSYGGDPGGIARGGTSNATLTITNKGAINADGSSGGSFSGIYGYTNAFANALAANAGGGTAFGGAAGALTTIVNSGRIHSYSGGGIYGSSYAGANGYAFGNSDKSSATGGTAVARTIITNTGAIIAPYGTGISGYAQANAIASGAYCGNYNCFSTGPAFKATGGTAFAYTTITNSGAIKRSYAGFWVTRFDQAAW